MYGASFGKSMHRRNFHDANLKTGRPGRARVAAAAGAETRGADTGCARRHLRRADGGGRARVSGSQRPHAGRHRGRADTPRTAAVLHRLRHAHHPRGRHVFRPRAAVRHERGRHRARQSLPRPGAAAAWPGADDPAAVFRHAGGHSLFLGTHRLYRARAGRALSHARRRGVWPQRARPAAVVSDARQRAEARVLQRRAPTSGSRRRCCSRSSSSCAPASATGATSRGRTSATCYQGSRSCSLRPWTRTASTS